MDGYTPADVMGAPRKGIRVLYSTDTRPVPAIETYGAGSDLMILEGMFGDPEKQERAETTHHMMMQEAAEIAAKANARELWLTHYSPATSEPEIYQKELKATFAETVIAQDGQSVTLQFRD